MKVQGWELELEGQSALLVGSLWDPVSGTHLATASLEVDPYRRVAFLPGSSVRGVLREALRRFVEARSGWVCQGPQADCRCPVCRLFGTSKNRPGKLRVGSATAPARWLSSASVAIDRTMRTAWLRQRAGGPDERPRRGGSLWTERKAVARFTVHVQALTAIDSEEQQVLEEFWRWLELTGLSIGQRKSAGAGTFTVRVRMLPSGQRAASASIRSEGAPRRYALRVHLEEPAHIVGSRQRDFYREGLDVIPGSTLRGAIGWALDLSGAGTLARDLFFSESPVLVGPAFHVQGGVAPGQAIPWLSRRRCRGAGHIVDLVLDELTAALGGAPPHETCPRCGAPLERVAASAPPKLFMGHTAIDPRTRRAAAGQLYYHVTFAPGVTFEAQLVARPDQAGVIAELTEVFLGGRRSRGMGRARLELVELPAPAHLEERVERTMAALRIRGARPDGPVAVVGLVSDAAPAGGLATVLSASELRPVAGEVRTVERGGWDELNNAPRALREVLAAGSWIAVRVGGQEALGTLAELERAGMADPQGIAPLIVSVRDDWEVVGMAEDIGPAVSAAAERDRLVREVRELCRKHRQALPARAQLHNLLRYAQQTDSVEEVALFFEYQASRRELRPNAPFLNELASLARRRYGQDPQGIRALLALVTRAAEVERSDRGRS